MEKIASGIYMILNLLNGKRYIGSAVNLRMRRHDHFSALRRGTHKNPHLQNAFNKYGENTFGWVGLEYIEDIESLLLWEDIYLKMYWPTGLLYNHCPTAGSMLGFKHEKESKETRRKKSKAALARWADPEYRRNQLDTNPMLKSGEQHPRYGTHHGAETKQKMSKAKMGERNPNYGKSLEDEHRRNISRGLKRHWADPEQAASHRHAVSTAVKKYWAHRRQE